MGAAASGSDPPADLSSPSADDELVEVVDVDGNVERLVTRGEMRAANLRHRSVGVVVLTSDGGVVAHRRADWKDVWPGRWDVCFGGVAAVGEDWTEAARRELAEEAGIAVSAADLREVLRGGFDDDAVSTATRVYVVGHDGPVRPDDGEVVEVVTVALGELDAWLDGRSLCADAAALVVPYLRALAADV